MKPHFVPKLLLAIGLAITIVSVVPVFTGCATKLPVVHTNPSTGVITTNIEYVLPPWSTNVPAFLQTTGQILPPPYGTATTLAGLGLSAVLAFYLRLKNNSLKSSDAALGAISSAALVSHIGEDLKRSLVESATSANVMNNPTVQTIVSKPKPDSMNTLPPNLPSS